MNTTIESNTTVSTLVNILREDIASLARGEQVGDSGVCAPRVGGAEDRKNGTAKTIARELFPNNDVDRRVSYILYSQTISRLRRVWLKQQDEAKFKLIKNPKYRLARTLGQRSAFEDLLSAPVSYEIANPTAMPVDIAPASELQPIFQHMQSGLGTPFACQEFDRGAIYKDGRIDMCKQVVGPPFIEDLTLSITNNPNVRHFLIGNNVVGNQGAVAIAKMIERRSYENPIETLYLAGNSFTDVGVKAIGRVLSKNSTVNSLWLKRNPLGPNGVYHLAQMLRENTTLSTLDLVNTATGDEGVKVLFEALRHNTSLKTLYLDANAITSKGCRYISDYFDFCKLTGL